MRREGRFQIGEVAEEVGLSIPTIRHYDQVGLVEPSGRSPGGFRLYTHDEVERLRLLKSLKPLQFSLEEMQELLVLISDAENQTLARGAWARLETLLEQAEGRCRVLRSELRSAEQAVKVLRDISTDVISSRDSARPDS